MHQGAQSWTQPYCSKRQVPSAFAGLTQDKWPGPDISKHGWLIKLVEHVNMNGKNAMLQPRPHEQFSKQDGHANMSSLAQIS